MDQCKFDPLALLKTNHNVTKFGFVTIKTYKKSSNCNSYAILLNFTRRTYILKICPNRQVRHNHQPITKTIQYTIILQCYVQQHEQFRKWLKSGNQPNQK